MSSMFGCVQPRPRRLALNCGDRVRKGACGKGMDECAIVVLLLLLFQEERMGRHPRDYRGVSLSIVTHFASFLVCLGRYTPP